MDVQDYPNLFKPITIRNITFRNRIFSTPNQTRFKDNVEMAYMEAKARGGAAQVSVGETPITGKYVRQSSAYTFVLDDPRDMRLLAETALAIRLHGAVPSIQLYHPGKYTVLHSKDDLNPIGPMGFVRDDGVEVRAMDEALIEQMTESYGLAAAFVKRAGFPCCQVHGGHGWLLSQFLSPLTNHRKDRYGGSLENRARLPKAVVERIREKCGQDFIIEYRISGDELVEGGMRIDEVIEFIKMIETTIDLVHVSVGVHESPETVHRMFPHMSFTEHGCNVHLAAAMKKAVDIPVITLGGISDPAHAERILEEGKADIIGMARALLADPQLPNKARNGRKHDIIPCIRCNRCLHGVGYNDIIACSLNPQTGRELRWQTAPRPGGSRKVLIIGGGPAGMEAAITAVERGHDVTLLEKSGSLGGLLKVSDYDPLKDDIKVFKDYLIHKTLSMVNVRLNTEATKELVEEIAPDVVIAAVGSSPLLPPIPGITGETVMTALDAYYDATKVGQKVAIIGGGLVGCEVGLFLAEDGKDVTIVEMTNDIGDPVYWRHTIPLVMRMDATSNLEYRTNQECTEITTAGIRVKDRGESEDFIEADTVIIAAGMVPNRAVIEELRDSVRNFFPVGDCVRPQNIMEAMQGGYYAALDII
jgi:2,4-dienoyl-CoA reductase-like NADH-dependent reductase (Old Yellow Enzyme family)/thioredoxin reductase